MCLLLLVFPTLEVMLGISTIGEPANTCGCAIPINVLHAWTVAGAESKWLCVNKICANNHTVEMNRRGCVRLSKWFLCLVFIITPRYGWLYFIASHSWFIHYLKPPNLQRLPLVNLFFSHSISKLWLTMLTGLKQLKHRFSSTITAL